MTSNRLERVLPDDLIAHLEEVRFRVQRIEEVSGGDIHRARRITSEQGESLFLKSNDHAPLHLFEREAEGLAWLAETKTLRVPRVLGVGRSLRPNGPGWLLLEWIPPSPKTNRTDEALGAGLAQLHAFEQHSLSAPADNFIGPLPQSNRRRVTWTEFYFEERLLPLLDRALTRGIAPARWRARFARLGGALPSLVGEPVLSRLHGDLWAGNVLTGPGGTPYLIDPACSVGHREVDLAMMQLFGGFSPRVFAAYDAIFPRDRGAEDRVPLYQLYPLLVHVNLFGGSYASMVDAALAQLP